MATDTHAHTHTLTSLKAGRGERGGPLCLFFLAGDAPTRYLLSASAPCNRRALQRFPVCLFCSCLYHIGGPTMELSTHTNTILCRLSADVQRTTRMTSANWWSCWGWRTGIRVNWQSLLRPNAEPDMLSSMSSPSVPKTERRQRRRG